RGSCSWQKKERWTLVEHASAFTVGNDLPTNPQTLFRCQCARTSVSWLSRLSLSIRGVSIHTLNIPTLSTKERNAPCIPIAEAKGFTGGLIKLSLKAATFFFIQTALSQ